MSLTAAENKFFESRGQEVDASLSAPDPEPVEAIAGEPPPAEKPAETPPEKQESKPETKQEQHVPLASLHAERERRRQIEAQLQEQQRQFQQLQQRIEQLSQPPAPDPNEDPMGALSHQLRQSQTELQQLREWRTQQEQAQQQQKAYSAFTQRVISSENTFRQQHPDYDQAAAHALQQYDKLLQASFPDPAQRQQQIQWEAANALARAVNEGRDPAEFVYSFAKSMGYAGPAPATPTLSPPAAPPAPAPEPEVVTKIQKGLKQQTNLGSGGGTPSSEMTPEMLANMDAQAVAANWDKYMRRR